MNEVEKRKWIRVGMKARGGVGDDGGAELGVERIENNSPYHMYSKFDWPGPGVV